MFVHTDNRIAAPEPSSSTRSTTNDRGQRGATLVEASISMMLVLTVIFAIGEFGLAFRDWISACNGAREGARIGALYGADASADWEALQAVEATLAQSAHPDGLQMVRIYDADSGTGTVYAYQPATTCGWSPCPDPDSAGFATPGWAPSSRDVTAPITDRIGVEVYYQHTWVTGLFADTSLLHGLAEYVVEPQEF